MNNPEYNAISLDELAEQPYFETIIETTNLVTGEKTRVTLPKTDAVTFEPVYERSRPIEVIPEHYLYGSDIIRYIDVTFKAFPHDDHGTVGTFNRLDRQD